MDDTSDSSAQGRWLLLVPQLPAAPDYLRVKLRRRLQRIGAVLLKSSVYALPSRDDALEDFHWLRREIIQEGGEAMLWEARPVGGVGEIEALFRADRDARYAELTAEAHSKAAGASDRARVARLRRRLNEVIAIDYFASPGRADAEDALAALERVDDAPAEAGRTAIPSGTTWVTRRGVKVDRICSAWLIRRRIDPDAAFRFVAPGERVAPGEVRFDMFDGEFTHEGDRCTFETLLVRAGLEDPGLRALGEIVHDIDCRDAKFGRSEVPGIAALIDGLVSTLATDEARLEAAMPILDGLHAALGRSPR